MKSVNLLKCTDCDVNRRNTKYNICLVDFVQFFISSFSVLADTHFSFCFFFDAFFSLNFWFVSIWQASVHTMWTVFLLCLRVGSEQNYMEICLSCYSIAELLFVWLCVVYADVTWYHSVSIFYFLCLPDKSVCVIVVAGFFFAFPLVYSSLPSCLTSSSPFQYTFDWIWIAYVEQIFFCFVFVLMLIFCECVFQHSAARWAVFRFSSFDMCARLSRTRKLWNLIFFSCKKTFFFHILFGDKQWKLLQYSQGE